MSGTIVANQQYENHFSFPSPPHDFSATGGYATRDFSHHEFGFQEDDLSLLDHMFLSDPLCTSLDSLPNYTLFPDYCYHHNDVQQKQVEMANNTGKMIISFEQRLSSKQLRIENKERLSRREISKYFKMPIGKAARELKVGITLLKKRCRELGIRRWPHRKLKSLQTLINNLQEMVEDEEEMRKTIEILEQEKKLVEEFPDIDLEDKTKRLRQICFKASYNKKRKVMGMMDTNYSANSFDENTANCWGFMEEDYHIEEELMPFLSDFGSSSYFNDILL